MKSIFLLTAMLIGFVNAFGFKIEYGTNVTISKPVHGDLYAAGGTITINAPVYGDLVVAGGTVIINDTVKNDVLVAGGEVTVNGFVGDDIRCAGGEIRIEKNVAGDVVVSGGSVVIAKGATIGGMLVSGGDIVIDGDVNGEVRGAVGELSLNGNVLKDMDCRGGEITINGTVNGKSALAAKNIKIGNNAAFNGDVRYWNKKGTPDFKQSLKNSKAVYDPSLGIRAGQWYYLGSATILGLLWYLGMALLMILIVQYLFSTTMKKAANTSFNNTLKSLGFGFLFFIAVPLMAAVAFITIIGVPVGLLLVFGFITLLLLATVIISVVASNWLNNRNNYKWNYWRIVLAAFGIFIVLKMVSITPFVGWLIMTVMACITFGAILLSINWKRKQTPAITA